MYIPYYVNQKTTSQQPISILGLSDLELWSFATDHNIFHNSAIGANVQSKANFFLRLATVLTVV